MPLMKQVVGTAACIGLGRLHSVWELPRPGSLTIPSDIAVRAHDAGEEDALQHLTGREYSAKNTKGGVGGERRPRVEPGQGCVVVGPEGPERLAHRARHPSCSSKGRCIAGLLLQPVARLKTWQRYTILTTKSTFNNNSSRG